MEGEPFKIWKNPTNGDEATAYMGEFYPPDGQICFLATDLQDLGFSPGHYTIQVPDSFRTAYVLPPWQRVIVR